MNNTLKLFLPTLKVHAVDNDRGPNGDIYYQLVKGNGELFRVGRKSGLITLRTDLTEDYSSEYTLTIAAYDGGTPPYSAEIVVVIKVVDESVPLFEQQLYTASVKENVQPNTPLLDVKATSPTVDSITGMGLSIYYVCIILDFFGSFHPLYVLDQHKYSIERQQNWQFSRPTHPVLC